MNNKERIKSALPPMPESFDRAVEKSLQALAAPQRAAKGHIRRPAAIAAALAGVLLLAGTAFGLYKLLSPDFTPERYLTQPEESRTRVEDVEMAIASARPESGDYSITLLPDLPDAGVYAQWRENTGQPEFSLADWDWLYDIVPEIREVMYNGDSLVWNTNLHTENRAAFMAGYGGSEPAAQRVDAIVDSVYYTVEGDPRIYSLFVSGYGLNPKMEGVVLYADAYKDVNQDWAFAGKVTMTQTIRIIDCDVDVMANIATVALITHSFSFEADDGAVREALDIEVPLSGEHLLTVSRYSENGGFTCTNELLNLSGVVLNAHVDYRSTGIYLRITVKEAPAWWEADKWYGQALLCPNYRGGDGDAGDLHGLHGEIIIDGERTMAQFPNGMGQDGLSLLLPIFPSEYKNLESVELRLVLSNLKSMDGIPLVTGEALDIEAETTVQGLEHEQHPLVQFTVPLP